MLLDCGEDAPFVESAVSLMDDQVVSLDPRDQDSLLLLWRWELAGAIIRQCNDHGAIGCRCGVIGVRSVLFFVVFL
jgi:hypothetical protein